MTEELDCGCIVEGDAYNIVTPCTYHKYCETDKRCTACGEPIAYSEKHDAYYCRCCKKWLEDKCKHKYCHYCFNRRWNEKEWIEEHKDGR